MDEDAREEDDRGELGYNYRTGGGIDLGHHR
jgi:hypothetical protein